MTIKTYKYTYPSIFLKNHLPSNYEYYVLDGEYKPEELTKIIDYSKLINQPINITFYMSWKNSIEIEQYINKWGVYYPIIERTVLKDLKKIGEIKLEHKYKKKKENQNSLPLV